MADTGDWQHCLFRQLLVHPTEAAEGRTVPVAPLHGSLPVEAVQTAAERMDAVNASVDALNSCQDNLGVPAVQYGFADGYHCTLYK